MEPIGPGMPLEKWLERRWMGRFANILVEHGLKDLAAVQAATSASEEDRQKVIKLFEKPGHRLKIRLLLDELAAAFAPKPSAPAPAPPTEEAAHSEPAPPLPSMPSGAAPAPPSPSDVPPVPGELLSPRGGHEEYEIESESSSESSGSDDEADNDDEGSAPQPASHSAVAADAFDDLPPPPVPSAAAAPVPAPTAPSRPVAPPPPPPGSKSPPPPIPPVPQAVPQLPEPTTTLSPPPAQPASLPAFPDSDDSDSDEEPGEEPAGAAAAEPPAPGAPGAPESHKEKDTVAPLPVHEPAADKPAPGNRVLQQSESFRKRQEAFLAQASQNAAPAGPKPPISLGAGAGAVKSNEAFKNKVSGIGAALAGAMARGPPVFKKPAAPVGQEEEEQPPPVPLLPSAMPEQHKRPHGIPAGAMAMPGFAPAPVAHSPPPPPAQAKSPPPIPDSHKPPPPASAPHHQPQPSLDDMHRLRVNTMLNDLMGASGLLGPEDGGPETEYKLPLTSSLTNPDKTGTLEKRGTQLLNQVWKARYFILKGADLFWLKSKQDKQPSGMIHLTERGLIVSSPEDRLIEIFTARKTYLLRAPTASEQGDWIAAIRDAQSKFSDDPSNIKDMTATIVSNQVAHRASMASIDPNEAEVARLMKMLKDGSLFVKYKHKKGHERMIWCPSSLDRILWADDMQRKKVKGYIMMADVVRITDGCFGSKRNENAFTVISNERTLELEARSIGEKNDWVTALNYLTQVRRK